MKITSFIMFLLSLFITFIGFTSGVLPIGFFGLVLLIIFTNVCTSRNKAVTKGAKIIENEKKNGILKPKKKKVITEEEKKRRKEQWKQVRNDIKDLIGFKIIEIFDK